MIGSPDTRARLVRQSRFLNLLTLAYNTIEGVVAIAAGLVAGSVALVGFGIDSGIELAASLAALWRLSADMDPERRERVEARTIRIIGICFLALAAYVLFEAARALLRREAPRESAVGIVLAALSLVIMPLLSRAKRRVGLRLTSGTLVAEARQTMICSYLSAILLGGLILNAALGWWWADPVAAIVMTPFIAREGIEGLRGHAAGERCCG
ncbi:MAG: cation transporter [Candidatus Eisenbacteria bacterium]|nr:cation transporter [Candidatus Eisenbacteria bacterium]